MALARRGLVGGALMLGLVGAESGVLSWVGGMKTPTSREADRVRFVALFLTTYCNLIKHPKLQVGVLLSFKII